MHLGNASVRSLCHHDPARAKRRKLRPPRFVRPVEQDMFRESESEFG